MKQTKYIIPDGFYTTKQAALVIGRTESAVKHHLKKSDSHFFSQRGKVALWKIERVMALAERLKKQEQAKQIRAAARRSTTKKPMKAPTYRGRMCPFCKKVEVPTGQYCCDHCAQNRPNLSVLEDNWIYH